jgi:UDPglucose 6-dehydrogenase
VKALPSESARFINLTADPIAAVAGASALVVATAWPEYRGVPAEQIAARMTRGLVIDATRFLGDTVGCQPGIEYLSVGRGTA